MEKRYEHMVKEASPKSHHLRDWLRAFWVGGTVCAIAQCIMNLILLTGTDRQTASGTTTVVMIFIGATLTGLGVYDDIGRYAGAGSIVPVTGFANSVVSAAMEFSREGLILGTAARMFQIAGPVIVYGVSASVVYGLIYWITTLF